MIDLDDERLHRRRVPWRLLEKEGVDPHEVLIAAQKRRLWKLALSAKSRMENQRRKVAG